LSIAFAIKFSGNWLLNFLRTIESGKLGEITATSTNLKDVSMAAAGLKALASVLTVEGIEECRKMCGGK